MCVAGEAANGFQALELYGQVLPDVVTMDYNLPEHDGVAATKALRDKFPDARVLMLSVYQGQEFVWRAFQAGVVGYCPKAAETREVINAIRQVADGQSSFSPSILEKLKSRRPQDSLTARELEVVQQIVAGKSNKEIMDSLNISQSTVKRHIERSFVKLRVHDRSQAISVAIKSGLVQLD
jgi:DNA-binding NarL/FixJ family response regulator